MPDHHDDRLQRIDFWPEHGCRGRRGRRVDGVASALIYRPADWLATLLVLGAGLQAVVVICSKAASVANAMRQAVDDVLESVDTIVWESSGRTLNATTIYGPIERMFGWPIEKHLQPGSWEELIHHDDMGVVEHAKQATAAGDGHTIRYRIRTLTGAYRWIEDTVNVVKNDRGEVTHTRGLCRDVSDAVAASQFAERYVQFIDSLPLGVMILELVDPSDSTSFVVRAENPSVEPFGPSSMANSIGQRLIDARPEAFRSRRDGDGAGLVEIVAEPCVTSGRRSSNRWMWCGATGSNCTYRSGSRP